MKGLYRLSLLFLVVLVSCKTVDQASPNVIFIMMDDLGYGQFGLHNDQLTTDQFDPLFVELVSENEAYDLNQALEFSKSALPNLNQLAEEGNCQDRSGEVYRMWCLCDGL